MLLLCPATPFAVQAQQFGGEVALASQLVDQGVAITPSTPVLQGAVSWTSPNGWSGGLAAGVEVRSPGNPVIFLARVSRSWALSGDWLAQANLLHYDYRAGSGRGFPDRAEANLYFSYRDAFTIGASAIRTSGARQQRLLGAANVAVNYPLAPHVSVSAGFGVAQAAIGSHDPHAYRYRGYRQAPIKTYGYGSLGLVWSDGPVRLQLARNFNSLGSRRVYGAQAAEPWVATVSWSF